MAAKHFIRGDLIAFDTETTGLSLWKGDKPFGFSFCNEDEETVYWEFDVDPFTREPIPDPAVLQKMKRLLEDPAIRTIGHNIKFDARAMELAYGIGIANVHNDTLVMAHNCNTLEPALGLKYLGDKYAGVSTEDQKLLKKAVTRLRLRARKLGWNIAFDIQKRPDGTEVRKAATAADYWLPRAFYNAGLIPAGMEGCETYCERYAVLDVIRTMRLYKMYEELLDELNVRGINRLEMDLWHVVWAMETRGVCTDRACLKRMMEKAVVDMQRVYPDIEKAAWPGFQPKKDAQVRELFYEKLGFEVEKWTKGGKSGAKKVPAVDKFVILKHIETPVVRDIAEWKANYTAYTTFFSKFDRLSIPDPYGGDTALHCDYRQVGGDQGGDRGGVATGRLSSATPNLQNVMTPENTMAVHPLHVRPGFIPRPGYVWLCIDYEGMEIRMFAGISQEPAMMKAINEGRSIHDEMTDIIWGGEGNEEALKQAVRALSLDGTGIGTSPQVDELWRGWGITAHNVASLSEAQKYRFADEWLAAYDYSQVQAQAAIGRKNSKTTIKSLSFLKIYGGRAQKATLLLKCSKAEAQKTLDMYDRRFPKIDETFRALEMEGKQNGFITSRWGRRLEIDPSFAYRATNYMVQGSSADLMKRSLVRMHAWLRSSGVDAHIVMTIHDEIVIEVKKEELSCPFIRKVSSFMCDTEGHLPIDMTVEAKVVTENWSIKHKVRY